MESAPEFRLNYANFKDYPLPFTFGSITSYSIVSVYLQEYT